ncbi:MAG: DUF3368 domain-containing protein [Acidobacteria bacterium]|nr:DUF3368 domain-containing protein [Acidobacteriota bacterium]
MIIISDTTPLHYLILIDEVRILPSLLGKVVIPTEVFGELTALKTPQKIKDYLRIVPDWLLVRKPISVIDEELNEIDPGERAAILLAEELAADGILIDDLAGRRIASARGLRVIGTLGLIEAAGERGLLNVDETLDRIIKAGFFVSRALELQIRNRNTAN